MVNPPESLIYRIGQVVCFICAPPLFLFGVINCIKACKRKTARESIRPIIVEEALLMESVKAKVEVKNDAVRPCKTEIRIRKILGLSILVLALPFVVFFAIATTGLSLLSILSIVAVFGIYMLQNKGYNLGKDLFFVLVGLVAYILPFSIFMFGLPPVAPLTMLKRVYSNPLSSRKRGMQRMSRCSGS
ncbi:MAG: hypothetical protein QW282_01310 [Nitrososphaerales archaeon]